MAWEHPEHQVVKVVMEVKEVKEVLEGRSFQFPGNRLDQPGSL